MFWPAIGDSNENLDSQSWYRMILVYVSYENVVKTVCCPRNVLGWYITLTSSATDPYLPPRSLPLSFFYDVPVNRSP